MQSLAHSISEYLQPPCKARIAMKDTDKLPGGLGLTAPRQGRRG